MENRPLLVSKQDGRTEEFDRTKLLRSIVIACAKRPVPQSEIDALVDDIEDALTRGLTSEAPASLIGEMVMERLAPLDRVAYVRFASVYRNFQDIGEFQEVVHDLNAREARSVRRRTQEELPL